MAQQLGEAVGQTVGYRIRFESKVSAATRIEVVTEGILTRLIQDDPELAGIGAILFDEFHERHLAGDLGAALALDVQATLRPDLRLLVMSATLDGERIAQWLDAPRLSSPGAVSRCASSYPPARSAGEPRAPAGARRAAGAGGERRRRAGVPARPARDRPRAGGARADAGRDDVEVVPLHGELSLAEQQARAGAGRAGHAPRGAGHQRGRVQRHLARHPRGDRRRSGARAALRSQLRLHPAGDGGHLAGLGRPARRPRRPRGRRARPTGCGRRAGGWSPRARPEIAPGRTVRAGAGTGRLGHTAASGAALPWLDPPPAGALAQARDLLRALGALDADGRITALGRQHAAAGRQPAAGRRRAARAARAASRWSPICWR